MEERIKIALEFLKEGKSFTVGDLRLGAEKPGVIEVTGWSQYKNFASLTKQKCLKELEEIKVLFYKMVSSFPELKDFIGNRLLEFNLDFDDYGKASIGICSEKNNEVIWEAEIK